MSHNTRSLPHASGIHEHASSPAVDIELLDDPSHASHARPLFRRRHGQGEVHRRRTLIDIVRVNDERVGQLAGRPGELAENENPLFIVPGRDEFFGHQIHSVMKTADDTQVGPAVMHHDVPHVMMPDQEMNRPISLRAKSCIDALGQCQDLLLELCILLDLRAARSGDLHKGESSDPLRFQFQEPFDGQKSFKNALGVIQTLDAQADPVEDEPGSR